MCRSLTYASIFLKNWSVIKIQDGGHLDRIMYAQKLVEASRNVSCFLRLEDRGAQWTLNTWTHISSHITSSLQFPLSRCANRRNYERFVLSRYGRRKRCLHFIAHLKFHRLVQWKRWTYTSIHVEKSRVSWEDDIKDRKKTSTHFQKISTIYVLFLLLLFVLSA